MEELTPTEMRDLRRLAWAIGAVRRLVVVLLVLVVAFAIASALGLT
jgi:hypothetical protein